MLTPLKSKIFVTGEKTNLKQLLYTYHSTNKKTPSLKLIPMRKIKIIKWSRRQIPSNQGFLLVFLLIWGLLSGVFSDWTLSEWGGGASRASNLINHSATADVVCGIVGKKIIISSRAVLGPRETLHWHNQSSLMAPTKSLRTYSEK